MRLHISSTPHNIFRPVPALRGYSDSVVRFRIEQSDLNAIKDLIGQFNIEDLADELACELAVLNLDQVALVFAILNYEDTLLSPGLISAYALRSNVTLSSEGFNRIIEILEQKGILIAQTHQMVIKYKLQKKVLESLYAVEA